MIDLIVWNPPRDIGDIITGARQTFSFPATERHVKGRQNITEKFWRFSPPSHSHFAERGCVRSIGCSANTKNRGCNADILRPVETTQPRSEQNENGCSPPCVQRATSTKLAVWKRLWTPNDSAAWNWPGGRSRSFMPSAFGLTAKI